jgi:hypothetical protein
LNIDLLHISHDELNEQVPPLSKGVRGILSQTCRLDGRKSPRPPLRKGEIPIGHFGFCFCAALFFLLTVCSELRAQAKGPVTGLDISLESLDTGYYDRTYRCKGTVYEVIGIAGLRPAANAEIRARLGGKQIWLTTDERGLFQIKLRVPKESEVELGSAGDPELEIEVHKGRHRREYAFPVSLSSPLKAEVRTDRRLYEPGETVHFWSRLEEALTGRPLADIPVVIIWDNGENREIVTSEAGVAAADFVLAANETSPSGTVSIRAEKRTLNTAEYTVGKRPTTDLLVSVKATPETVRPGEPVSIEVEVLSVRGTPMRGAAVSINVSKQEKEGRTDAKGKAIFQVSAPLYSAQSGSSVSIKGTARHAGCRAVDFHGSFSIQSASSDDEKPSYTINVLTLQRGLIPEVNDRLIVSVDTEDGPKAKNGTIVELRGSAFKGTVATATVDRHGFASVPIRLARSDYAKHASGDCADSPATTIEVTAMGEGRATKRATFCVGVSENALVLPIVTKPSVGPGESFEVTVERRPEAAEMPVSVELFCGDSPGSTDAKVALPSSNTVRLTAPKNRLGLCTVRARPMLDVNKSPSFGLGVSEPILVRPELPSFPTLTLDSDQYMIKERAKLTIHTPSNAPRSWAAVAVRDLAQHQGEPPFVEYFMGNELEQAVLDPSTKEADLLVRAAMTAYSTMDENAFLDQENEAPGPAMEYDAARLAVALRNDTVGKWMVAVEALASQSLQSGTMEEITVGKGALRRFRSDAIDLAMENSGEDEALTLGEGKVTTDMLSLVDSSFTFETAARRVARKRLVYLLSKLASDLNPEENDETRQLGLSAVTPERRLSDMVRRGVLAPTDLRDPWGNTFVLRKTGRPPCFVFSGESEGFELLSPGPDGAVGTSDDVRDPWERAIPEGTLYARASGEDRLMALLSAISPGSAAFEKLMAAYDRLNDEAVEELIGDAIGDAFGFGGLGLSGTGEGGGGTAGDTIGLGSIGTLGHGAGSAARALAGMLREDFPATLYFKAEAPLSRSGNTTLEIPLAQAATTYIVEAIIWREDGWRWSASTEIHVDQDFIVDAPLPERAIVGDEVALPVRISNRTDAARTVHIEVTGTDELGISPIETKAIQIPSADTIEVPVKLSLRKAASGKITIAAFDTNNKPIDAVRRAIVVKPSKRRAQTEIQEILRGSGKISLDVPQGAEPAGANEIAVTLGSAVFYPDMDLWSWWVTGLTEDGQINSVKPTQDELSRLKDGTDPTRLSMRIGAEWTNAAVKDDVMKYSLETLANHAEKEKSKDADSVRTLSRILMLLAPALNHIAARDALRKPLLKLMGELRNKVESGAALFADAPWLCAQSAAALLYSAPKKKGGKRAAEFLSRARRAVITIDGDPWFEGGRDDAKGNVGSGYDGFGATAALAAAEIREGNDDDAYKLLRSLVKRLHFDSSNQFGQETLFLGDGLTAATAALLLGKGKVPSKVTVAVDKERHEVDLTGDSFTLNTDDAGDRAGIGRLKLSALGQGGLHTIEIKDAGSHLVMVNGKVEYTVDWTVPPPHVGPFIVRVDGKAGLADDRSGLKLVIRNRIPRAIMEPVIEISLPAGAEVDEEAKKSLARWTVSEPMVSSDTLTLKLLPLRPQEEVVIPLPWLWTAAGRFTGLGVTAWAADRPDAITVLPATKLDVSNRASTGGGEP